MTLDNLSTEELERMAWETGALDYLVFPHQQELWSLMNQFAGRHEPENDVIKEAIKGRELVVNISRRFGKSTLGLLLQFCLAIETPNQRFYFVAPTEGHAKEIVSIVATKILRHCPDDLRPDEAGGNFTFKNGSQVRVGGVWNGARSMRGGDGNGAFVDEAAFIPQNGAASCLQYVLSSVLSPMLLTTRGWTIVASTPPPNMKHDYVQLYRQAEQDGRLIVRTIYQNTSLTDEDIAQEHAKSLRADPTGTAWRREYLAELVPAGADLIVPELTMSRVKIEQHKLPDRFDSIQRYIIFDHGTVDLNAVLFGYYDFENNKKVVQHELNLPTKLSTKELAKLLWEEKEQLWGNLPVFRCVADAISHQLVIDLNDELYKHGITFVHPSKRDLEGMVNQLIIALDDGGLIIDPSCVRLLDTMRSGTWLVSPKTGKREFARLNEIGHCDFLAALVYFNRSIVKGVNPHADLPPAHQDEFRNPYHVVNTPHDALVKALTGNKVSRMRKGIR